MIIIIISPNTIRINHCDLDVTYASIMDRNCKHIELIQYFYFYQCPQEDNRSGQAIYRLFLMIFNMSNDIAYMYILGYVDRSMASWSARTRYYSKKSWSSFLFLWLPQ